MKKITKWCNKRNCFLAAAILAGILGTRAISYLLQLMTTDNNASGSFLIIFLVGGLVYANYLCVQNIKKADEKFKKRRVVFLAVTSFLFSLAAILGFQCKYLGATSTGMKGKLFILLLSAGLSFATAPFLNLCFILADRSREKTRSGTADASAMKSVLIHKGRAFLLCWLAIFAAWIPIFLAYYPAVMSYDFNVQSIQAYNGMGYYCSHHPLIHTLMLRGFFLLAKAIGSYEVSMAIFCLLQMAVLAAVFAYTCVMSERLSKKKWPMVVSAVFFALLPIHSVLSVSITKDVLFTAFFLLFMLLLTERVFFGENWNGKKKVVLDIATFFTGVMMLLFRNNAIYAFLVFTVLFVAFSRKDRLRAAILCVLILVAGKATLIGLEVATQAVPGSKAEMFSVPMQQFARTGLNHAQELSEEDYAMIDWYVHDEYWSRYNPPIADTVKITVSADGFENWEVNMGTTLKDWLTIGLKYPNDYLDAFLQLTRGYWFVEDTSYADVLGADLEGRMGILYTFNSSGSYFFEGIKSQSILPGLERFMENIVSANCFFKWPVAANLWKPACYIWVMILCFFISWYRKEYHKFWMVAYPLIYLATLFLGPVALVRYAYPFIVMAPLFLVTAWGGNTDDEDTYEKEN